MLNLAKKTHLITRRFLCYPIFSKKGFLLKFLLVAFFFAIFFSGCFAKVFLCQRVNKNYCGSNTKLKVFVFQFSAFLKRVICTFFFFGTCYPVVFHPAFFFFSFFSEPKADRQTMWWIRAKKGQNRKATSTISAKNLFSKITDNTKNAFFFFGTCYLYFFLFWNVMSRSFSSCFFPILKGKRVVKYKNKW